MEDKAPPEAPPIVHDLLKIGGITGIQVEYRQTGIDSAETYWIITGTSPGYGKPRPTFEATRWAVEMYIEIKPNHAYLAHVKPAFVLLYDTRQKYEKTHATELAHYEKLKAKFG